MKKGLRKWRTVDGEENQKQVSHRRPRALGNRYRDSHIPAAPAHRRDGKVEIQRQDSPFSHARFVYLKIKIERRINPSLLPCSSGSSLD
jgi:hypothetical protein